MTNADDIRKALDDVNEFLADKEANWEDVFNVLSPHWHTIKSALEKQLNGGIPEGYVLVPKEPTKDMLDEVCSTETRYPTLVADDETMTEIYKDMIAAAPQKEGV